MSDFRLVARPILAALLTLLMVAGAASATLDPCAIPAAGTVQHPTTATVTRVASGDTLVVDDGREIRLSSIAAPRRLRDDATSGETINRAEAARQALARLVLGQRVEVHPVTDTRDRFGRLRAHLVLVEEQTWIAAALLEQGVVRVEPRSDDYACARVLQAIETKARTAGLGLWGDPRFKVIAAIDPDLISRVGQFVLIEGKVVSTGQSGTRRYLNFGPDFRRDFAVVLDDKSTGTSRRKASPRLSRFAVAGFESADIVGRVIRVRGVLMPGGGGLMLPSVAEEIEWVSGQP